MNRRALVVKSGEVCGGEKVRDGEWMVKVRGGGIGEECGVERRELEET